MVTSSYLDSWGPLSPPCSARSSGDGGERCCRCLLESGSGVGRDDGDPLRLSISSSSAELSTSWSSLLLLSKPLPFAKRDMARTAPIALRQRARGSKFSRRPQRSCSVGAAKLVSHVCDSTCLAMSRRGGLGWRRVRMKLFVVMDSAKVR